MKRTVFPNRWLPYLLVLPQMLVTIVFFFWPAGKSLYLSVFKSPPFGGRDVRSPRVCERRRQAAHERAERAGEVAGDVVRREESGAFPGRSRLRERGLLRRQKDAHVARRRVQRTEDGDDQERPERRQSGESDPGREHDQRRADEHAPSLDPMAAEPECHRERGRAEERPGHDRADPDRREPEPAQIAREKHAHEAVHEAAEPAYEDDAVRIAEGARGGSRGVRRNGGGRHEKRYGRNGRQAVTSAATPGGANNVASAARVRSPTTETARTV